MAVGLSAAAGVARRDWAPQRRRYQRNNRVGVVKCERREQSRDPLLVQAAKSGNVPRPPVWMMRQAGRYMAAYRKLAEKYPSFRQRSETTDLIVEITLQPWGAFRPDGVIIFSDILTPLPAIGVNFEIDDQKGPIIENRVSSPSQLHSIDLSKLEFVGESLGILRKEVGNSAAVLGFVGAPWTLATYLIEGGSTRLYKNIKKMCYEAQDELDGILSRLATEIAAYLVYQIRSGAQCVQIFDSWGGQLTPDQWDRWSKPYIQQMIRTVNAKYPGVPVVLYANGNAGLLERMSSSGADVIGLDWTVDMLDGRQRLGNDIVVQGNVDPCVLFSTKPAITDAINSVIRKAGSRGHILNLGHGVVVGTPEENVEHFFETARSIRYETRARVQS